MSPVRSFKSLYDDVFTQYRGTGIIFLTYRVFQRLAVKKTVKNWLFYSRVECHLLSCCSYICGDVIK